MNKDNLKCICFMIVAMAGFAVEDAIIKKLSDSMPISQVLFSIGILGLVVFFALARITKIPIFSNRIATLSFGFRMLCELISSILFVVTIVFVSLSISSAILQTTPLMVALGGSLFLKQNVAIYQWILIFIGFLGVLLVIQPGSEEYNSLSILALIGAFFLASRDLVTRSISESIPAITVAFWGFFSLMIGGLLCIPFFNSFQTFSVDNLYLLLVSAFFGPFAYLFLVFATRLGEVAVITPYRYTRLPFGLFLGFFLFDEKVSPTMLVGCILIVASGAFLLFLSNKKN